MKFKARTYTLIGWLVLLTVTLIVHYNNDYMRYKEVPVTFVDRSVEERCHKSRCHNVYIGLYKTDDGVFFDQDISFYQYSQMHLGERFTLTIRQFDIKQNPRDNLIFFLGQVLLYSATLGFGLVELIFWIKEWMDGHKSETS